ncbi:MAG: VOC family protein [Candidatus Acidiferrales bacterium]
MATSTHTELKQLRMAVPVFAVRDIIKSAEHFRDVLGFSFDRYWGEPPCFVILARDSVEIDLVAIQGGNNPAPNRTLIGDDAWDAYFWVRDSAELAKEFESRGAKILRGPEKTFYDTLEIELEDLDGYRLCFGQDISE